MLIPFKNPTKSINLVHTFFFFFTVLIFLDFQNLIKWHSWMIRLLKCSWIVSFLYTNIKNLNCHSNINFLSITNLARKLNRNYTVRSFSADSYWDSCLINQSPPEQSFLKSGRFFFLHDCYVSVMVDIFFRSQWIFLVPAWTKSEG